jgi:hypothetical protein
MYNFKKENGKYIVSINGAKWVFNTYEEAWRFYSFSRV